MEDEERLNRLTPREHDVYKAWQEHPDWSNAQIGRAVYLPPHVVRRYRLNIKRKLADLSRLSPRLREVYDLDQQGLGVTEIAMRLQIPERLARVFLEQLQVRLTEWSPFGREP